MAPCREPELLPPLAYCPLQPDTLNKSNILTCHAAHVAEIRSEVLIEAPLERVWEIVSDIDNEPKFWKGTKEVRNISADGGRISREVTLAFGDKKCTQDVTITPRESIDVLFTGGMIKGTKRVELEPRDGAVALRAIWNIKMGGMIGPFSGIVGRHVRKGTESALHLIKEEAER
ncbi:conserved hypothetical protein [Cenarchaeum symbiosum A]|uniref:Coenzyme Q-binding protein COQ10 START domain-containing protein n=1 Tax=Cenarchaeum symbiosum (strain A) TaxID=414004 RepID=A0RWZ1_CENSY|nr:conserved hypothetical protein [Cenarchaeum symbiosum A]